MPADKKQPLVVAITLAVCLVVGVGAYFFLLQGKNTPPPTAPQPETPATIPIPAKPAVVVENKFASLDELARHYAEQGFVMSGRFVNGNWPERITSEQKAVGGISFQLQNGQRHQYTGSPGQRYKLVRLEDANGTETVAVFYAEQNGSVSMSVPVSSDIPATNDWNVVGQVFDSFNSLTASANNNGFALASWYDTPQWPARVVSTEEGTNTVYFELKNGRSERYQGGEGVQLKVVYVVDAANNKNVLVFRSKQSFPANTSAPSVATPQPTNETYAQSIARLDREVARRREAFGNESIELADTLGLLSSTLRDDGQLSAAEAARRENLSIRLKVLGEEHPQVALSYEALGSILQREGKLPEAEDALWKSLAIRRKVFGDQSSQSNSTLSRLNEVLKLEGKPTE